MSPAATRPRWLAPDEPLHVRLMSDVKRRLEDGEWAIGARLPTEAVLSEEYGVSRATVRTSIKLLESQGLVRTRQGAGTFATAFGAQVSAGLQELRSTTATIRKQGFEPTVDCKLAEIRTISTRAAEAFGLEKSSQVVYLERSIKADGRIVAFCYEEIVHGLIDEPIAKERFDGSLFEVLKSDAGVDAAYAATDIHSVHDAAIGWGAEQPNDPLYLLLVQAHFDRAGEPLVLSRNYFVEGAFRFSLMRVS